MLFSKKYTVTFLNSKWEIIKSKIKLNVIPQRDEYVYMNDRYYDVLNVVHSIGKQHTIHIVIEETKTKFEVNPRPNKKN
jgi:hypothetical protein